MRYCHFNLKRVGIQSTLPVRGATRPGPPDTGHEKNYNPRSPCGERPSADACTGRGGHDFNPRSPCGERHRILVALPSDVEISIHAPRAGSDPSTSNIFVDRAISIHAPRAGSDLAACQNHAAFAPISIHAPRAGSDTQRSRSLHRQLRFQSTLPVRGATEIFCRRV